MQRTLRNPAVPRIDPVADYLDGLALAPLEHEALAAFLERADVGPTVDLLRGVDPETGTQTVDFLRRPLHPELRLCLASWLEGEQTVTGPKVPPARALVVGNRIHELWDSGVRMTDAKCDVAEEFGLGARTVEDCYIRYRRIYFRAREGGWPFAAKLKELPCRKRRSKHG